MSDKIDKSVFNKMNYASADKTGVSNLFKEKGSRITKDTLHNSLMAAGMTPGIGNVADAADALLYLSEGKVGEAGLSALSMVPIIGQYISGRRALNAAKKSGEEMVKVYRGVMGVPDPKAMVKGNMIVGDFSNKFKYRRVHNMPKTVPGKKFNWKDKSTYTTEKRKDFDGIMVKDPRNPKAGMPMSATLPLDVDDTNILFTTTDLDYATRYAKGAGFGAKQTNRMVLEFEVPKSYINKNGRFASGYNIGRNGGYDKRAEMFFWDSHPNVIFTDGLPFEFLTKTHKF